jgi:hypothetical protein
VQLRKIIMTVLGIMTVVVQFGAIPPLSYRWL